MSLWPQSIQRIVEQASSGDQVVFDADGTLWRGDLGEDFLRFIASQQRLVHPAPAGGVYARYEQLHRDHPAAAYAYAVSAMAGLVSLEVSNWATEFFRRRFAGRVFTYVRPLLAQLRAQQVSVWVCSASPRWVIEAGAAALGLSPQNVIAVDAELNAGVITTRVLEPVPAGPGKVTWLRRRGLSPVLAVGNGDLDLDMLRFAKSAWVIAQPDASPSLLVREALARGWPISRV